MSPHKYIFIINGFATAGKDTFIRLFKEVALSSENAKFRVQTITSMDKIKPLAKKIGWDSKSKTEKDRKFLSDLKLLISDYNDGPFMYMRDKIYEFMFTVGTKANIDVLFIMLREPEEIQRLVNEISKLLATTPGPKIPITVSTILIDDERKHLITSNMADANVFNFKYDITINNNSDIEDLRELIRYFIKGLMETGVSRMPRHWDASDFDSYNPTIKDGYIILDKSADASKAVKYATLHDYNVKDIDTGSSKLADTILLFTQNQFRVKCIGEECIAADGTKLNDKPVIIFEQY